MRVAWITIVFGSAAMLAAIGHVERVPKDGRDPVRGWAAGDEGKQTPVAGTPQPGPSVQVSVSADSTAGAHAPEPALLASESQTNVRHRQPAAARDEAQQALDSIATPSQFAARPHRMPVAVPLMYGAAAPLAAWQDPALYATGLSKVDLSD